MPLRLYLDDDSDSDLLIAYLESAGHTVLSPRETRTTGLADVDHLAIASQLGCALVTHNGRDFVIEHLSWLERGQTHNGIMIIYRDRDSSKNMSFQDVLRALSAIEDSGLPIENGIFNPNEWQ